MMKSHAGTKLLMCLFVALLICDATCGMSYSVPASSPRSCHSAGKPLKSKPAYQFCCDRASAIISKSSVHPAQMQQRADATLNFTSLSDQLFSPTRIPDQPPKALSELSTYRI